MISIVYPDSRSSEDELDVSLIVWVSNLRANPVLSHTGSGLHWYEFPGSFRSDVAEDVFGNNRTLADGVQPSRSYDDLWSMFILRPNSFHWNWLLPKLWLADREHNGSTSRHYLGGRCAVLSLCGQRVHS